MQTLQRSLIRSAVLLVLPLCCAATAGHDLALEGCWRSQQIELTLADRSHRDQNGDCVTEYDGTFARSYCQAETGKTESLSRYERIGRSELLITPLDVATDKPTGASSKMRYRIVDRWLLTSLSLNPAGPTSNDNRRPTGLKAVSIRVPIGNNGSSRCEPRGRSALRVGRTPKSSLAMHVPPGWHPLLVDPATDGNLGHAVGNSFLIGEFAPLKGEAADSRPSQLVLVLDDTRYGASPVRQGSFGSVKKRFTAELGIARPTCDEIDRVCASLQLADGRQVYTELFNVNGRVVMVSSTGQAQFSTTDLMRRSVRTFVEQLRADNEN